MATYVYVVRAKLEMASKLTLGVTVAQTLVTCSLLIAVMKVGLGFEFQGNKKIRFYYNVQYQLRRWLLSISELEKFLRWRFNPNSNSM